MSGNDQPIGIFDSGLGGLTVMSAVAQALPHEHLLYLGDTARVPYGARSPDTVRRYAQRVAGHLFRRGIKTLVIACNTATTWALPVLREAGAARGVPVVGVIGPGVEAALRATRGGSIAVIGTEGTIRGGGYARALAARSPDTHLLARACPLFVALAEEGWHDDEVAHLVARRYLSGLGAAAEGHPPLDTLILGCTHYPLLRGPIAAALPGVRLVDSASATTEVLARVLRESGLARLEGTGSHHFLVTDHVDRFTLVGARFLGSEPASVELVDLDDQDGNAFLPPSGDELP